MRHLIKVGCLPMIAIAAIFCSGCIVSPRPMANQSCGPVGCAPCGPVGCRRSEWMPTGMHHPVMRYSHPPGNPYVVYPPSGGTVSITPGGVPPASE